MEHEEIIAMAREAGFRTGHIDLTIGDPVPFIAPASGTSCMWEVLRFATLVAAKEREACAQVCEDRAGTVSMFGTAKECAAHNGAIDECAAAIRARGKKEGV